MMIPIELQINPLHLQQLGGTADRALWYDTPHQSAPLSGSNQRFRIVCTLGSYL